MKLLAPFLVALLSISLLSSCNTKEKYAQNNAAADAWLKASSTSTPKIDVSGAWTVPSWGGAALQQQGREVLGEIGNYDVKGVVSGYRAYLTVYEDGWVYYTMVIRKESGDRLEGVYSSSVPFSVTDASQISFQRMNL